MADDIPNLPLVVSSSSGSGGVSPRVSMMSGDPGQPQVIQASIEQLLAALPPIPGEVGKALKGQIATTAAVYDRVLGESQASAQSYGAMLLEMTRVNAQKANNFFEDLASAKTPAEILAVHAAYWRDQQSVLAENASAFQAAFLKFLATFAPAKR